MKRLGFICLACLGALGSARAETPAASQPPASAPGPIAQLIDIARAQLPVIGFERQEARIDGKKLIWWQKGTGPPVVMIHGVADQAATWLLVAPAIGQGRQVLLIDLPGHGDSEPTGGPLKMSTVLLGLEGWLQEHVRVQERPAVLVGNSMGAWLAALVAHRHPSWVEKTILINGGPIAPHTGGLDLIPEDREEARRLMAAIRDPSFRATSEEILDDLVVRAKSGPASRMLAEEEDLERHLLTDRLGEIESPVFLVWGASDRYLGEDFPKRLMAELPNATLMRIPRCGHLPQVECPLALVPKLSEILDQSP